MSHKMYNIVCLEGCHGTGKTSLCRMLSSLNYEVIYANYAPPMSKLPPNQYITEMNWIGDWFSRIAETITDGDDSGGDCDDSGDDRKTVITNRSPFSALIYANPSVRADLSKNIQLCIDELKSVYNIKMHIIMVHMPDDMLLERIHKRLEIENGRLCVNEGDDVFNLNILADYKRRLCEYHDIAAIVYNMDKYKCVDDIILHIRQIQKQTAPTAPTAKN